MGRDGRYGTDISIFGCGLFVHYGNQFVLEVYNRDGQCVVPVSSEEIRFGYNNDGLIKICLTLPLEEQEAVYGSGERFNELNQVGKRLLMWNLDCGYMFENWETAEFWRGYKNVPILHSSRGYTIFSNTFFGGIADIGYTDENVCTLEFEEENFDFFFWTGTARENLADYTKLTGRTILLPKWAYAYSAGGGNKVWHEGDKILMNETAQEVKQKYEELGTPDLAAIYIEGIAEENKEVYELFQNAGIRVLKWNSPNMSPDEMTKYLTEVPRNQLPELVQSGSHDNYGNFMIVAENTRDLSHEMNWPHIC